MPSWFSRCRTTAGSSSPHRVPIGRPSSAENPIVVAMLRPARRPQSEAPLPRWATTTRPSAIPGAAFGKAEAMYS